MPFFQRIEVQVTELLEAWSLETGSDKISRDVTKGLGAQVRLGAYLSITARYVEHICAVGFVFYNNLVAIAL